MPHVEDGRTEYRKKYSHDLEMRHALTVALQDYEGTFVVISHDRRLLDNTAKQYLLVAEVGVPEGPDTQDSDRGKPDGRIY